MESVSLNPGKRTQVAKSSPKKTGRPTRWGDSSPQGTLGSLVRVYLGWEETLWCAIHEFWTCKRLVTGVLLKVTKTHRKGGQERFRLLFPVNKVPTHLPPTQRHDTQGPYEHSREEYTITHPYSNPSPTEHSTLTIKMRKERGTLQSTPRYIHGFCKGHSRVKMVVLVYHLESKDRYFH